MMIKVEATDLRDDRKYSTIVESWETLDVVRAILADQIPGATSKNVHFYVRDSHLNVAMPVDQLRKMSRAAGMLGGESEKEDGDPKVARCFVWVGASPIDFDDMMLDGVIKKLRSRAREMKEIQLRVTNKGLESKYRIQVDSGSIMVHEFRKMLQKKIGPASLTGLDAEKMLFYERGVQPGRPLEGPDFQPLFGTRIRIDIDGYLVHDPVVVRLFVKKWLGLLTVEQHELTVEDHLLEEDLVALVAETLKDSVNKNVAELGATPEAIHMKVNGFSLNKHGSKKLIKKFGVPPEKLWLRAFELKDRSPVVVYI
ncbi:hypothetical protein Esti_000529 [Eimeria stiedai]